MNWSEILPGCDDPVKGSPCTYFSAAYEAEDLKTSITTVADEFERVTSSDQLGAMKGQAARQLFTLMGEIDSSVTDVPPLIADLEQVFRDHERRLTALQESAASALARAQWHWDEAESARSDRSDAQGEVARLNQQIRQLESANVDGSQDDQIEIAEINRISANGRLRSASTRLNDAEVGLTISRREHEGLASDYRQLVSDTSTSIRDLDLGGLQDPNAILAFLAGVGSFVWDWTGGLIVELVEGIVELVAAALSGDWGRMLWALSDLIGTVLKIAMVISIAAMVIGTGGAGLPALLAIAAPIATTVTAIGSAAKLVVTTALFATQSPHPETGRTVTGADLFVDGVFAATGGLGLRVSSFVRAPAAGSQAAGRGAVRNFIDMMRPNPTSMRTGAELFGAAATSSIDAAARQVTATALTVPLSYLSNELKQGSKDGLNTIPFFDGGPLTTNSDAWTADGMAGFAAGANFTDSAVDHIETGTASVNSFANSGPSSSSGAPNYCLAPTG